MVETENAEKVYEDYLKNDWGDGLPIIPPTEERVGRMLEFTDRKRDLSLGKWPPLDGDATVEMIAVNAVMAGCKPEYFPVVLTVAECAMKLKDFMRGTLATTGNTWPGLIIVNGPVAKELDINSSWGIGAGGPNRRANMTIARTVTLCSTNIGGAVPGVSEKKPCVNMMRNGFCFAENEEQSPWEPLHVERGFDKNSSTVTFGSLGMPIDLPGHGSHGPTQLELEIWAEAIAHEHNFGYVVNTYAGELNSDPIIILQPVHAKQFAMDGFRKQDVKRFIWERARVNYDEAPQIKLMREYEKEVQLGKFAHIPKWMNLKSLPITNSYDDIIIVVAGSTALELSEVLLPASFGRKVTKAISFVDGTPVKSIYDFKRNK